MKLIFAGHTILATVCDVQKIHK